jgi:hypothetical protein
MHVLLEAQPHLSLYQILFPLQWMRSISGYFWYFSAKCWMVFAKWWTFIPYLLPRLPNYIEIQSKVVTCIIVGISDNRRPYNQYIGRT